VLPTTGPRWAGAWAGLRLRSRLPVAFPFQPAVEAPRWCFGGWTIICMIQLACGSAFLINNPCIRLFCKIPSFTCSQRQDRGHTSPSACTSYCSALACGADTTSWSVWDL